MEAGFMSYFAVFSMFLLSMWLCRLSIYYAIYE